MIVLTAPTSNIGRQALALLIDAGREVRVIVRDPSRLPASVRARVDIVAGSHRDGDTVERAFQGADTLFWLVPPDIHAASAEQAYVGFSRPAAGAIRQHGVRRVVVVSGLGRGSPLAADAGLITASLAMEDLIAATGAATRVLTLPSFMDNIGRQAQSIMEQGVFFGPIDGERKLPACATGDIAAAAAQLLLDDAWSGQQSQAVLGPDDLSYHDMAGIMTEVLCRPVRYQQISYADHKAGLLGVGMSEGMAAGMSAMYAAKDRGIDNVEARTPANTTPTSFRQWCEQALRPLVSARW